MRCAIARRAGLGSTAITRVAPARSAPWIAARPTAPAPITIAASPQRSAAMRVAAPKPVITAQPSRQARSSGISAGMRTAQCAGTTQYSAKLPRYMS